MTTRDNHDNNEKHWELGVFLFLTFVLWPLLAVILVGGYGLAIWISQWFLGPPGPS